MAESKPKVSKPRAPRKKKVAPNPDRVCVLNTTSGIPLVIRSNPSEDEVRSFIAEHHRRYLAGESAGPSGDPAFEILDATYYASEEARHSEEGEALDILEVLEASQPST